MIVAGNILRSNVDIIVQQVNCSGKMGAGLSGEILDKYPSVKNNYLNFIRNNIVGDDKHSLMGRVNYVDVHGKKLIANIFAQLDVRENKKDKNKYTDEDSLLLGIEEVFRYSSWRGFSVGIPFKIGCGLGGGDWKIVHGGIIALIDNYGVDCKIYDKGKSVWEGLN